MSHNTNPSYVTTATQQTVTGYKILQNDGNDPVLSVQVDGQSFPSINFWGNGFEIGNGSEDPSGSGFLIFDGGVFQLRAGGSHDLDLSAAGGGDLNIGTASADKIGFHGAAASDQAAHIADATINLLDIPATVTSLGSVVAFVLDLLEEKGLMAP